MQVQILLGKLFIIMSDHSFLFSWDTALDLLNEGKCITSPGNPCSFLMIPYYAKDAGILPDWVFEFNENGLSKDFKDIVEIVVSIDSDCGSYTVTWNLYEHKPKLEYLYWEYIGKLTDDSLQSIADVTDSYISNVFHLLTDVQLTKINQIAAFLDGDENEDYVKSLHNILYIAYYIDTVGFGYVLTSEKEEARLYLLIILPTGEIRFSQHMNYESKTNVNSVSSLETSDYLPCLLFASPFRLVKTLTS